MGEKKYIPVHHAVDLLCCCFFFFFFVCLWLCLCFFFFCLGAVSSGVCQTGGDLDRAMQLMEKAKEGDPNNAKVGKLVIAVRDFLVCADSTTGYHIK